MLKKYYPRIVDTLLLDSLRQTGAVYIVGPKWCGKTSTAKQVAKSVLDLQNPDTIHGYLMTASTKPSLLLEGNKPRLIDEWQVAPVLWDSIRYNVDQSQLKGQFILTGSVIFDSNEIMHTGTGRISKIVMRPMSLFESLESNGSVSLKNIFDGQEDVYGISTLTIEKLAFALARGGWPSALELAQIDALSQAKHYIASVIEYDISKVVNIKEETNKISALIRSYARNIATQASIETILNDINSSSKVSLPTITKYIEALIRLFVIEDLPAWSPALRSKTPLRETPKRHFVDPSLACAVLGINDQRLLSDFKTFGFLFESLVIRDLRIYAESIGGKVFHYRDKNELEVDAVIQLDDGRWGAVEIKLGSLEIEKAADNLKKFKEKVDTDKMKQPSFLMIITGSVAAMKREDGIIIVPIGCLKN